MAKKKQLIKRLQKLHWVWFWSGNWPLLDDTMMTDEGYARQFIKIAGISPRISIGLYIHGMVTEYHCEEEYERLGRHFRNKMQKNPLWIINSVRSYEKQTRVDIAALKKINRISCTDLNNRELAQLFLKARHHFEYNAAIDHFAWYVEKFFIPVLQDRVQERLKLNQREHHLADYMAILVSPRKPSRYALERQHLFSFISRIQRRPSVVRAIQTKHQREILQDFPEIQEFIQIHLKKFCWISVLVNNTAMKEQDIWKDI